MIDPLKTSVDLTEEAVRLLCDWHFGIGSDGILYGPFYEEDTPVVRMYFLFGCDAEKSGIGGRIFASFLMDAGY